MLTETFKGPSGTWFHERQYKLGANCLSYAHYRPVVAAGESLVGSDVTISGYVETVRGRVRFAS